MLPDRVSNPGPLTYESGALPIALRGPAQNQELKPIERVTERSFRAASPQIIRLLLTAESRLFACSIRHLYTQYSPNGLQKALSNAEMICNDFLAITNPCTSLLCSDRTEIIRDFLKIEIIFLSLSPSLLPYNGSSIQTTTCTNYKHIISFTSK